jgi:5-methylcytosine-specific restriction endonuclease McrBC GTP-binding regulatory subunit McrB
MAEIVQNLLEPYQSIVEKDFSNSENYKWDAIQHFQKFWIADYPTDDFHEMFKKAFSKRSNLMFQNSFGFLNKLAETMPEEAKKLFILLFNDDTLLEQRIVDYQSKAVLLLPLLKEKTGKPKLNHQQDERTISFLLTLHNPEKYYLYKDNVYQWLCELKQVKSKEAGQKYFHFCELAEGELAFIQQNEELKKLTQKFIPKDFQFDSTKLIFQDILYRTMPRTDEIRKTYFEVLTEEVKGYLESINHPLVEHVWRDITKNYRWISIWKDEQIDPYFLHYEITLEKNQITIELHPEGSEAFKIAFEPFFLQHVNKSVHTLKTWHFGLADKKKGNYHKIVSKTICTSYTNEVEPTTGQIQAVAERLIEYYDNYQVKIEKFLNSINFFSNEQTEKIMAQPALNQILYGPPGTGKTFSTTLHALSIIEEKSIGSLKNEKIEDLVSRYKQYKEKKIIDFVTFHQSYSYEDFMEGIKPVLPNKGEYDEDKNPAQNSISYSIEDGIFKEMCLNADSYKEFSEDSVHEYYIDPILLEGKGFHKISLGNTQGESGDIIYNYCKENSCIAIGWGGDDVDYSGVKDRKEIKTRFEEAGYDSKDVFNINAIERLALWIKPSDIIFVSHGNKILKAVGIVEGDYEHRSNSSLPFSGYNHFRKVKWLITDARIPVHEVYYANFSQQSIYALWSNKVKKEFFTARTIAANKPKNHVLIIDEINRGNVSAIFGELITLIEENKRKGKDNELSLTLPYSKKPFTIPPNLYIIGTMNTADRSVEALDTALRRRFSFVEMLPKPELLSPSAMFSRLMWKYKKLDWKDSPYLEKETALKELFGIPNGAEWDRRIDIWNSQMKDQDESVLTHLDELNALSTLNLQELLQTINARIEVLVDRDHTIGHSYFMDVDSMESLKHTFKNKIIPLLQEYFYGDYRKMEMVIGQYFFDQEKKKAEADLFALTKDPYDVETVVYQLRNIDAADFNIKDALDVLLKKKKLEDVLQIEKKQA